MDDMQKDKSGKNPKGKNGIILLIVLIGIICLFGSGLLSSFTDGALGAGIFSAKKKFTDEDLGFLAVCCCEEVEGGRPDQVYVYVDDYPEQVIIEMKVENKFGGESMLMQLQTDAYGNARDPILNKKYKLGKYEKKMQKMKKEWPRDWAYHLVKNGEIAG